MTTHGRDKTGPARDDEMSRELRGELRAGHPMRAEEWRELQPSGEDQPRASLDPQEALVGGTPPGMDARDVELRSELARHLGRGIYPAGRSAVLRRLRADNAPDRLLTLARGLPGHGRFHNVQDVTRALGLGVEAHRT